MTDEYEAATQPERIVIDTQYRQGLIVEKYIIKGEPGIHYEVVDRAD